jgi:thiosulfate dehydrogenase
VLTFITALAIAQAPVETDSSIARGGLLYDNWAKVIGAKPPAAPNPAYPKSGKYRGKEGADYRCKECHGWDYRGKEGAYASGSHATGIKGIRALANAKPEKILAVLQDERHGYQKLLKKQDLADLASFVAHGQLDMDRYIDRKSKKAKGDAKRGAAYYNTVCAKCHGFDGKDQSDAEPIGTVARDNPWEMLHKILNGQPAEEMPALRAFDVQVAVDILTHAQTLSK